MSTSRRSAIEERMFWGWIAEAWNALPDGESIRAGILGGQTSDAEQALLPAIAALETVVEGLTVEGLTIFCRQFEKHMYRLDREDLADFIELGDDGFMGARATIIALGQAHYDAVVRDVRRTRGIAVERTLYVPRRAWEKRFGNGSYPGFGFPTGTASNPDGWPKVRERSERDARVAAATDDLAKQLGVGRRGLRVASKDGSTVKLPNLPANELAAVLRRVAGKLSPKGG
jgi:hypothetical protein